MTAQCHVQGESAKSHCSSPKREVPAFLLHVQLLNGPLPAAGESSYNGMNSHYLMCLQDI